MNAPDPGGAISVPLGVLLAGGRSQRMGGGDKSLKVLGGKPMLAHIIARARPQVGELIVNANGDLARFASFGLPVVADVVEGFAGPLAGILSALEWAALNRPRAEWVASFATDAPFFPADLVARLAVAAVREDADIACARTQDGAHPVFGLWKTSLRQELRRALTEENVRKVDLWTARHRLAHVDYATTPLNPFFNINRPEDLTEAEALLAREVRGMTASENARTENMNVGVVLERRVLADPWRDHVWHAVEVVPGAPADISWRELGKSEGSVRYLAATLPIDIFRKETESYRINVTGQDPRVFVVLRPEPDSPPGREMYPFLVTVCPFEAGSYGLGGDETVDAVPMPDEIRAWVEDFVARHHVAEPFVKRQRDHVEPDKMRFGRRRPGEERGG